MLSVLSRFSCVQLFVTPRTVAHHAPLSIEFSRQEYWSGLPCPPPGDLSNPGIKLTSPTLQVGSLPLSHQGSPSIREVSGYGLVALTVPHQSASGFQNSSSPQEEMDFPSVRYGNMQGLCIDIYLDGSLLFLIRKSHPKETSCTQAQRVFPAISVNKGCHCHQQLQPPWMMSW